MVDGLMRRDMKVVEKVVKVKEKSQQCLSWGRDSATDRGRTWQWLCRIRYAPSGAT